MPSNPQPPAASRDPATPGSPRRPRWLRRAAFLCGWAGLMVLALAALGSALLWVGYKNITAIANIGREQLIPDLPLTVGEVAFPQRGVVELRDLALPHPDHPAGDNLSASIKRVRVTYDPRSPFDLTRSARSLLIDRPTLRVDDALLERFATSGREPGSPAPDLSWLALDRLELRDAAVSVDLDGVPRGSWRVDLTAEDVDFGRAGERISPAPQRLVVRDLHIADPGSPDSPLIGASELTAHAQLDKSLLSGHIESLRITDPSVRYNPRLVDALEALTRRFPSPDPSPASAPDRPARPLQWTLGEIALEGGYFAMTGFPDRPDLSFHHTGRFTDIAWSSDAGLSWPTEQSATLTRLRIDAHAISADAATGFENPASPVLVSVPRLDLSLVPDEFFAAGWVESLVSRNARAHVTAANTARFWNPDSRQPDRSPASPKGDEPAGDHPWLLRIRELEIADAEVHAEADTFTAGLPHARTILNARSAESQPDEGDVAYLLAATEIDIRPPGENRGAMVTGDEILAEFSARSVQSGQRVEAVTLSGIKVRIGDEFDEMITELAAASEGTTASQPQPLADPVADVLVPPADAAADADGGAEWKIGTLHFDETRFTLEEFIPGLPYVPLVLETTLEEVPLSGRDRGDERMQRVELRNLEIASPYNSLLPVAKLKSIWIHFTIPGLFRSEIERVEIVSPEIYLGEHLFWYIDYYRRLASNEPLPGAAPEAEVAAAPPPADPCADTPTDSEGPPPAPHDAGTTPAEAPAQDRDGKIDAVEDALNAGTISGWRIKYVEASAGKLIVAPKGYPIGILPFPFSAKTNLADGEIALDLQVPRGDYVFDQLKLELRGLSGEAFFNYPIRAENNNFVQTFTVPELRYQDYRAEDVYLSVTYDEKGIYGELGGEAYGGYAKGEFNIYIGKTYKWDAWVAGTDLNLAPITAILAPETIVASGIIDITVIGDGEGFVPATITANADTKGRCHMHVTKLDDVLESRPEPRARDGMTLTDAILEPLNHALSTASIEAFRHYDFTTGHAKLELDGRDGSANILLDGPDGKRDIGFRFFDHRDRPPPDGRGAGAAAPSAAQQR